MVATLFRCFSSAIDHHPLLPGLETGDDLHAALRHVVVLGQELDQRFVRFSIDRARREPQLDSLAVLARKLGPRRAGLDVEIEDQTVAAAMRGARLFKTMS